MNRAVAVNDDLHHVPIQQALDDGFHAHASGAFDEDDVVGAEAAAEDGEGGGVVRAGDHLLREHAALAGR